MLWYLAGFKNIIYISRFSLNLENFKMILRDFKGT